MYRITPQDNDLKLDKNIASAFMNMRKTTLTDSMFWSNSVRGASQSEGGTSADRRTWASTTSAEPLFLTLADESNTSIQVDEILEEYEKQYKARQSTTQDIKEEEGKQGNRPTGDFSPTAVNLLTVDIGDTEMKMSTASDS